MSPALLSIDIFISGYLCEHQMCICTHLDLPLLMHQINVHWQVSQHQRFTSLVQLELQNIQRDAAQDMISADNTLMQFQPTNIQERKDLMMCEFRILHEACASDPKKCEHVRSHFRYLVNSLFEDSTDKFRQMAEKEHALASKKHQKQASRRGQVPAGDPNISQILGVASQMTKYRGRKRNKRLRGHYDHNSAAPLAAPSKRKKKK